MSGTVLWDFDGTLAERPGLWSQTMIEVLDVEDPGHGYVRDDLRPALQTGFPWHAASLEHPELNDREDWWIALEELLSSAYVSVGYLPDQAGNLARAVRSRFLDPAAWRVFDDTRPALRKLTEHGWRHVIVSNHVPELAELVEALGLGGLVNDVVTSAAVGFEKPHPGIFEHALELAGRPNAVWMVGDNPIADVQGAEALGIPAILVRREAEASLRCSGLDEAADLILDGS